MRSCCIPYPRSSSSHRDRTVPSTGGGVRGGVGADRFSFLQMKSGEGSLAKVVARIEGQDDAGALSGRFYRGSKPRLPSAYPPLLETAPSTLSRSCPPAFFSPVCNGSGLWDGVMRQSRITEWNCHLTIQLLKFLPSSVDFFGPWIGSHAHTHLPDQPKTPHLSYNPRQPYRA